MRDSKEFVVNGPLPFSQAGSVTHEKNPIRRNYTGKPASIMSREVTRSYPNVVDADTIKVVSSLRPSQDFTDVHFYDRFSMLFFNYSRVFEKKIYNVQTQYHSVECIHEAPQTLNKSTGDARKDEKTHHVPLICSRLNL